MSLSIDPARTAVLGLDLQTSLIAAYAKNDSDAFLARVNAIYSAARKAGALVVHVRVGFRPGLPEVSPRNMIFSGIKASDERRQMFAGAHGDIDPRIERSDDDILIVKSRVNAFAGTDLEQVLRARGIDTLVMFGIATSGVLLSTTTYAVDADYRLFIVEDCSMDRDETVHRCLMEKVYPARAGIVSAEEVIAAFAQR